MTRRWVRLGLLGCGVFLAALVYQFPAAWALHLAREHGPVALTWEGADGSVFDARVQRLGLSLPTGAQAVLGPVDLELQPLAALTGGLPVRFRAQGYAGEIAGSARLGPAGWSADTVRGRLPLGALPRLVPELAMAGLEGTVLFRARDLAGPYAGPPRAGHLRASLEDLRVGLLQADEPLGAYSVRVALTPEGDVDGRVETVADRPLLGVEGTVSGDLGARRLGFRGRGWAREGAPPGVRDILPLLGQVNDGEVRIKWQGSLP